MHTLNKTAQLSQFCGVFFLDVGIAICLCIGSLKTGAKIFKLKHATREDVKANVKLWLSSHQLMLKS